MSSEKDPKKIISRRDFLKASLFATGGVAMSGGVLAGCASNDDASEESAPQTSEADPIHPVDPPASWDYTADVVVVGTGGGGLNAALYAAEQGASVIAVEKNDIVGGASRHAAGYLLIPGGSKYQGEYAWPVYPLDTDAVLAKLKGISQYSFNERLLRNLINVGGEATDWLFEQDGVNLANHGAHFIEMDVVTGKQNAVLAMNNTINALEANAKKAGVQFMMLTKCETLVVENGRVVGIQVSANATGEKKFIQANKGVILCAGGIGMNRDLLEKYIPSAFEAASLGGPMPFHTGEAFRMGLGAGADYSGFNSWCCWQGAIDEINGGGDGQYWHYFYHGERQLVQNPWLLINVRGERLPFYSEGEQENYDMFYPAHMGDMANNAEWMSTVGHRAYCIFDSDFPTNVFKLQTRGQDFDMSRVPITKDEPMLKNSLVSNDWEAEVQQAIERGAIKKADTLEELADQLNLDRNTVVEAVKNWNEMCAKGEDTEFAIAYLPEWLLPIEKGPFYGAMMSGQIGKTLCGLRTDEYMQVMKPDGSLIPGLYANYSTAGGLSGESIYSQQLNGALFGSVATSYITGYFACKSLLAAEA